MSYYISCSDLKFLDVCHQLMKNYHLTYSDCALPRLELGTQGLCLLDQQAQLVTLDWNQGIWKHRAHGTYGRDPLVKVCLASQGVRVLDITAGWGRDALVLAAAGAQLTCLEQHPYMAALLAANHACLADKVLQQRIQILWKEAKSYLSTLERHQFPEVIYYDPMHPQRQKSALVKKHLQVLQVLVPPAEDVVAILNLARQCCGNRVVLKWPAKQAPVLKPNFSVGGGRIRFDVFMA